MKYSVRDISIFLLEEYHSERMNELIEEERFDDSHAIFEEWFIEDENNHSWMFLDDLTQIS